MAGIWRLPVLLDWATPGSPGVNVWHISVSGGGVEQDRLQAGVDAIHTFYEQLSAGGSPAILRASMRITAPAATDVDLDEARTVTWPTINTGGSALAAPPALQVCVGWKTATASRRGRGRTFLGPLHRDLLQEDGTPVNTGLTAIRTAADALIAASSASPDWSIAVYGLATAGGGPDSPHTARPIVSQTTRDIFAILRSRRD